MERSKAALICGIHGQDGSYLARFLLSKGYNVYGTSREADRPSSSNLERLGISDQVCILQMNNEPCNKVCWLSPQR